MKLYYSLMDLSKNDRLLNYLLLYNNHTWRCHSEGLCVQFLVKTVHSAKLPKRQAAMETTESNRKQRPQSLTAKSKSMTITRNSSLSLNWRGLPCPFVVEVHKRLPLSSVISAMTRPLMNTDCVFWAYGQSIFSQTLQIGYRP